METRDPRHEAAGQARAAARARRCPKRRPPRRRRRPTRKPSPRAPSRPRPLPLPRPVVPAKRAEPAIEHGRAAGVDRRSAERLRRGRLPVEARLDLHGYTQDQAHGALDHFLGEAQARGLRCVLVITGKGTTTARWRGAAQPGAALAQRAGQPRPRARLRLRPAQTRRPRRALRADAAQEGLRERLRGSRD